MHQNLIEKKLFLFVFLCFSLLPYGLSNEGMWLPMLLEGLPSEEMKELGCQLSTEDIYSVNEGSLKDAIVHFNGGCTAEMISSQGLLLTNHHCGDDIVQAHSTVEENYLRDGFWAMSREEEIPSEGVTATFILRIEDVTKAVTRGIRKRMDALEKDAVIDRNIEELTSDIYLPWYQAASVKPVFEGNQYILIITETYHDVRLVGVPPSSIGVFGGDTDNYEWPRHTGDFAMFRIYAGPDNKPARYDEGNVPYRPKHHLPISLQGVEEGDFTLVFGFPGSTSEYLHSSGLENIYDTFNPAKIEIREAVMAVTEKYMQRSERDHLIYGTRFRSVANRWKRWTGEVNGIGRSNAIERRKAWEEEFRGKIGSKRRWQKDYGEVMDRLEKRNEEVRPYALAVEMYDEVFDKHVGIFRIAASLDTLLRTYELHGEYAFQDHSKTESENLEELFHDYDHQYDMEVAGRLLFIFSAHLPDEFLPSPLQYDYLRLTGQSPEQFGARLFEGSILYKPDELKRLIRQGGEDFRRSLLNDPVYDLFRSVRRRIREDIRPEYRKLEARLSEARQLYMEARMEICGKEDIYPDANSTLRVSYGSVRGYRPRDAVLYLPQTWLEGVIEKYRPGDPEFDVHETLVRLYENKDFGPYGENGRMPVCFLGDNHTTGGNSGSPAIDARGRLVGINFDRAWEGTMSDYYFNPEICRNIMVDIRYILFIVDKFAGAGHLVEEMDIVRAKRE